MNKEKILIILILVGISGLAVSRINNFDIFWQLQTGRYMSETKRVLHQDTFTLAAQAPRVEHCWLHDLVAYAVYRLLGYPGLSILKGLLVTLTALSLIGAARIAGGSFLSIAFLSIPAILSSHWAWLARPQLWSFWFFGLFLFLLERHRIKGDRWIYLLFALMVLWSNLHAGAILAFPVLAAYLVGDGAEILFRRSSLSAKTYRMTLYAGGLVLIGSVVSPYGLHVLRTFLGSFTLGSFSGESVQVHVHNFDWIRLGYHQNPVFFYAMGVALFLMITGWRRLCVAHVLLLGGLAFMGNVQGRQIPLFFFAMAALLPAYLDSAVRPVTSRIKGPHVPVYRWVGFAVAISASLVWIRANHLEKKLFDPGLTPWMYPVDAAVFIEKNQLPPNLFNSYEWGGYLAWALYPDYRAFWDGRNTSKEMFFSGARITNGDPGWEKKLNRYSVRTIVLMPCDFFQGRRFGILDRLKKNPQYALVLADESSLVFVKRDAVETTWLAAHELSKDRIDDTVLSAAILLARDNPMRYIAYFEMFRVYNSRGEHYKALAALKKYLQMNPEPDPTAEGIYRMLSSALEKLERR